MDMLTGILRRRLTLDAAIRAVSNRPGETIEPLVRAILWVGTFQLLFSDHVADYAAVDSAVKLAGKLQVSRAGGFINAVLRSIQRLEPTIEASGSASLRSCPTDQGRWLVFQRAIFPSVTQHRVAYWSQAASIPMELAAELFQELGDGAAQIMIAANGRPPVICRVDRPDVLHACERLRPHAQAGYVVAEGGVNGDTRSAIDRGDISPQDPTAGLAAQWLMDALAEPDTTSHDDRVSPPHVLDLCAGRGTKTIQLAMGGLRVTASDIAADKLQTLAQREALLRTGRITVCPSGELSEQPESFDGVLVDVPCSNTGVLARRPEVRWRLMRLNTDELLQTQYNILRRAGTLAKAVLVYSTCSILPRENEKLVKQFLNSEQGRRWRLFKAHTTLPVTGKDQWRDGGYVAVMRRN